MNRYTEETLASCEQAFAYFEHVAVDEIKLRSIAAEHALKDFVLPRWDFSGVWPQSNKAFVSQCFWGCVLCFCFAERGTAQDGTPRLVRFGAEDANGKMQRGAFAMQACFYRSCGERPMLAPDILWLFADHTRCKEFFKGRTKLPLFAERRRYILGAAVVLDKYFAGNPMNVVEAGGFRAFGDNKNPGIVDLLVSRFLKEFGGDSFHDFSGEMFGPEKLSFYFFKRAQLFVLMYHGRACQSNGELPPISDVEFIGPIPDYIIPRTYDADGVFVYRSELRRQIDECLPIPRHSKMELEIRLANVWSQVRELKIINSLRLEKDLPPIHIGHADYWRFSRARGMPNNHHLTYTTDY